MKTTQENLLKIKSWLLFKLNSITISTCTYSWQYISSIFTVRVIVRVNKILMQTSRNSKQDCWYKIQLQDLQNKTKCSKYSCLTYKTKLPIKIQLHDLQINLLFYIFDYILMAEYFKHIYRYSLSHCEGESKSWCKYSENPKQKYGYKIQLHFFTASFRESKTKLPVQNTTAFFTTQNYPCKIQLHDLQINKLYYIYVYIVMAEYFKHIYSLSYCEG